MIRKVTLVMLGLAVVPLAVPARASAHQDAAFIAQPMPLHCFTITRSQPVSQFVLSTGGVFVQVVKNEPVNDVQCVPHFVQPVVVKRVVIIKHNGNGHYRHKGNWHGNGYYAPNGYGNGYYGPNGYGNGYYGPNGYWYGNGYYAPNGYGNGYYGPDGNWYGNGYYAPNGYGNGYYGPNGYWHGNGFYRHNGHQYFRSYRPAKIIVIRHHVKYEDDDDDD